MDKPTQQTESPLEILRRLENLLRVGTIAHVRLSKPARVRVQSGKLLTTWVPFASGRSGGLQGREWWPPVVGEQCILLSPGGDMLNAIAALGIDSDTHSQGSESDTEHRIDWNATDFLSHDRATGELTIRCSSAITLQVGNTVLRLTADGATVTPDIVAAERVSLVHHIHGEVRSGSDTSGEPV